jgi:hypothetical protein
VAVKVKTRLVAVKMKRLVAVKMKTRIVAVKMTRIAAAILLFAVLLLFETLIPVLAPPGLGGGS